MINLAIVSTVPVIEKHSLDEVLKPFINDINILSTTGISLTVHGVSRTFKGALLAFLGDNLASNDLGGFKKSFSFSFRSCRSRYQAAFSLRPLRKGKIEYILDSVRCYMVLQHPTTQKLMVLTDVHHS